MKDYPCLQGSSSSKRLNKDHLQPRAKGLPGETCSCYQELSCLKLPRSPLGTVWLHFIRSVGC